MTDFVAYIRVSTARQGRSGLGLDAQRQRILDFVGSNEVIAWHEEHESGAKSDRPELERALSACELTGSTLLVATLDRLTRDVAFLETVKRRCEIGGFAFRCADMPDATEFVLGRGHFLVGQGEPRTGCDAGRAGQARSCSCVYV